MNILSVSSPFVIRQLMKIRIHNSNYGVVSPTVLHSWQRYCDPHHMQPSGYRILFQLCMLLPSSGLKGRVTFLINLRCVCKNSVIKRDWSGMEDSFNTFIYCLRISRIRPSINSIIANNNNLHIISEYPDVCISSSFICRQHTMNQQTFYWALQTFLYMLVVIFYVVTC